MHEHATHARVQSPVASTKIESELFWLLRKRVSYSDYAPPEENCLLASA
jgi:hypothetical protein